MATQNRNTRQRRRRRLSKKGKIKVAFFFLKLLIPIIILCLLIRGCAAHSQKKDETITKAMQTIPDTIKKSDAYIKATTVPTKEEMKKAIKENSKDYPKYLTEFYEKYPQSLEFVYYYPEKKDKTFEINLKDDYTEGKIPLFIQWDERWGYLPYGDGIIGTSGCAPTCMSMVYVGLTGDTTKDPSEIAEFAEKNQYYVDGDGTTWEFFSEGAEKLGLTVSDLALDKEEVIRTLNNGSPIIANVGPGTFTTSGHYIVLTGVQNSKFVIHDPNSPENSEKLWEWGDFQDQVRNFWAFSK